MKKYTDYPESGVDRVRVLHPELSVGEIIMVWNTLEMSRRLEGVNLEKSKKARDVAYNFLKKRHIPTEDTVEETMHHLGMVI